MSNNYANTWLDAMSLVAKSEMEKAKFDQTVVATVLNRDADEPNKYWVTNGNIKFWAYADGDQKYRDNQQVYITIPQGDYNNKKIIIGSYETQIAEKVETEEVLNLVLGETVSEHTNQSKSWPVHLSPSLGAYDYVRWGFDLQTINVDFPYKIKVMNGETAIYTISSDELLGDPGNYLAPYHFERLFEYSVLPNTSTPTGVVGTSSLVWSASTPYLWRGVGSGTSKDWKIIGIWDETEAAAAKITTMYAANNSKTIPPEDKEELWQWDISFLDTDTYSQIWYRTRIEYIDYQGANEITKSVIWVDPQIIEANGNVAYYQQDIADQEEVKLITKIFDVNDEELSYTSENPPIQVINSTLNFYYLKDKILPAGADYKIYNEVYKKVFTDEDKSKFSLDLLRKPYYYDPRDNAGNVVFRPLLVSLDDDNKVQIQKYTDNKDPDLSSGDRVLKWYQYRVGASSIYRSWWSEMAEFPSADGSTTETISPWNFDIHTGTTVKVGDDTAPVFEGDDEHFVCCLVEGTNPETILATSSQISMYKKSYYTGEDVLEIVTPIGRSFLRDATTGNIEPERLTLEAYVAGNIDINKLEWYYTIGSITSNSDWILIDFIPGQDRKTLTISWDSIKDKGVTTIYYKLVDPVTGKSDMVEIYSLVSGKDAEYFDLKSSTDIIVKKADGTSYDPETIIFTVSTDKKIDADEARINWYVDGREEPLSSNEKDIQISNTTAQLTIASELVAGKKVKAVYTLNTDWYDVRSISTYTGAEPIYKAYLSNEYMVFSGDVEAEEEGKPETHDDFDLEFNVYRDGELISDDENNGIQYYYIIDENNELQLPVDENDQVTTTDELFIITRVKGNNNNKFHFQWNDNPVTSDNSNPKGTLQFKAVKNSIFELPLTFGWSVVGKGADAQSFSLQTTQDFVRIDSNGNPIEAEIECSVQASNLFSNDPNNERLLWTLTPDPGSEKMWSSNEEGWWSEGSSGIYVSTVNTPITIAISKETDIHVVYQSKQNEEWVSTAFEDTKKIITIADGQDPYICRLSNETIVWDNGVPDTFTTTIQITKGMSEELPNISRIDIVVEDNNWYNCTISDKTLFFQKQENKYPTSNSGIIPITVTLTDTDNKTLTFHLALSWSIVKDAPMFKLLSDKSYVVKRKGAAAVTEEDGTVSFTAEIKNLPAGTLQWYSATTQSEEKVWIYQEIEEATGESCQVVIIQPTAIKVKYTYKNGDGSEVTLEDAEVIEVINEGDNGLNVFLSNENETFANAFGDQGFVTEIYAFLGAIPIKPIREEEVEANTTYPAYYLETSSITGYQVRDVTTTENNTISVTVYAPKNENASIKLKVKVRLSQDQEPQVVNLLASWTYVQNGQDGAPGKDGEPGKDGTNGYSIALSPTSHTFMAKRDVNNNDILIPDIDDDNTVVIQPIKYGTDINIYEFFAETTSLPGLNIDSSNSGQIIITVKELKPGESIKFTGGSIQCYVKLELEGGIIDTIPLAFTYTWQAPGEKGDKGDQGDPGEPGKDSNAIGYKTQWYSLEPPVIPEDENELEEWLKTWSAVEPPLYYNYTLWKLYKDNDGNYSVVKGPTGGLTGDNIGDNVRLEVIPSSEIIRYGTNLMLLNNGHKIILDVQDNNSSLDDDHLIVAYLIPRFGSQIKKPQNSLDNLVNYYDIKHYSRSCDSYETLDNLEDLDDPVQIRVTFGPTGVDTTTFTFYPDELKNYYIRFATAGSTTMYFEPKETYNASATNNIIYAKSYVDGIETMYYIGVGECDFFSYGNNNGANVNFNVKRLPGLTEVKNETTGEIEEEYLTLQAELESDGLSSDQVYNYLDQMKLSWLWKYNKENDEQNWIDRYTNFYAYAQCENGTIIKDNNIIWHQSQNLTISYDFPHNNYKWVLTIFNQANNLLEIVEGKYNNNTFEFNSSNYITISINNANITISWKDNIENGIWAKIIVYDIDFPSLCSRQVNFRPQTEITVSRSNIYKSQISPLIVAKSRAVQAAFHSVNPFNNYEYNIWYYHSNNAIKKSVYNSVHFQKDYQVNVTINPNEITISWPGAIDWEPENSASGYFEIEWVNGNIPSEYIPLSYIYNNPTNYIEDEIIDEVDFITTNFTLPITSIFHGGILKATIPKFKTESGFETELTTYVQVPSYEALKINGEIYGPTNLGYNSSGVLKAWEDVPFSGFVGGIDKILTVKGLEYNITNESFSIYEEVRESNLVPVPCLKPIKHIHGTQIPAILITDDNEQYCFPLLIHYDLWDNQIVNDWTGKLQINEQDNYILSAAFAAGSKNASNQFTGVLMGAHGTLMGENEHDKQEGIFGYKDGFSTFGLNANGTMYIQSASNNSHYIGLNDDGELEISVQKFKLNTPHMIIDNEQKQISIYSDDNNESLRVCLGNVADSIYGLDIYGGALRLYATNETTTSWGDPITPSLYFQTETDVWGNEATVMHINGQLNYHQALGYTIGQIDIQGFTSIIVPGTSSTEDQITVYGLTFATNHNTYYIGEQLFWDSGDEVYEDSFGIYGKEQNNQYKRYINIVPQSSYKAHCFLADGIWHYNGFELQTTGSDARIKHDINLLTDKYSAFFNTIQPVSFVYNQEAYGYGTSQRTHIGFIANDIEAALLKSGLTNMDFAGLVIQDMGTENELYALRYEEFVALNTWQIQKLKTRVTELENEIKELKNEIYK